MKAPQKIWVVFTDQIDLWWLKFLRKGFRHCFVIVQEDAHWISIDPLSHRTEIAVQDLPGDFDLPRWLQNQGYIVVRAVQSFNPSKPAPLMLFSCVEAVKRILGIHNRFIITPWQLYRCLLRHST